MWALLAILLLGQTQASPLAVEPGVYVVTMGPGDASWEKFGHNMLWFHQLPQSGIDVAWNWGVFDFAQKNFILHFLQGKLWYWMDGFDAGGSIDFYLHDDRTIWLQQLNLTQLQQQELWEFCLWNAQEQHKYYKYDYFTNNCSTQVRDAIDLAIGGQIARVATTMPTDVTYRSETSRLMAGDLPLYIAINFILGQPVDRPLSAWQEMFIPMRMRERLNQIQIQGDGNPIPLVKKEILLHTSSRPPMRETPPNWVGWFLLAGAIIGAAQAWLGHLARRESRRAAWGLAIVAVLWSFLAGFAGWFLIYAWTLTDHIDTRNNENILQLSPLMLPLIVLIPLALAGWRRSSWAALILAGISLVGCAVGLAMKIFPAMNQVNSNMIALAIPANLGLVWALWQISLKGKPQ